MAKILVSMPDRFLESVDATAKGEDRTRSELIREALRSYLRTRRTPDKKALKNAEILDSILD